MHRVSQTETNKVDGIGGVFGLTRLHEHEEAINRALQRLPDQAQTYTPTGTAASTTMAAAGTGNSGGDARGGAPAPLAAPPAPAPPP